MKLRSPLTGVPLNLILGGTIVALVMIAALIAPFIAPFPYDEMHLAERLQAPGASYWLGTDEFGRDVLSRMLVGARLSLLMGVGATAISLLIGVPLGLLAGYYRRGADELIMRGMDVMMSIPPILLGLLILSLTRPSIVKATVAVGVVFAPIVVRVTRSVALGIVQEDFVTAARARGEGPLYILVAELLPNAWPPIIVEASLRVTFAILLGAALSFLGVGAQPPSSDWGLMISEARPFLDSAPWVALAPGIAMCITVVAVNLLGDGLREHFDPRTRRRST